ncbi:MULTISPECIES: ribonuclease P protein component [unclassified Spirosoma]|uniref:ribonuclease P protein component n=1 Tax=unclassified Spirosoma TaxID=2621999 RepID=UPI00096A0BCA|nr:MULTISPECIES: ribonuclease P protein component [unclassified Spirosoma]MBN8821250.1 ribonuclease P protein component [Spirosoma sp.]OJW79124.1 MAG: ribonuclease P protein component [Spirosoma sp. 48-14]
MPQTFPKSERLCSKKTLGELFKKGSAAVKTFYLFPFRVLYLPQPDPTSNVSLPAIVITVPKRTFKRAVDRNLIRRRVREAYRLHKELFQTENPLAGSATPGYIAFLYTAKQIISFEEIEKGMKLAIAKCIVNNVK